MLGVLLQRFADIGNQQRWLEYHDPARDWLPAHDHAQLKRRTRLRRTTARAGTPARCRPAGLRRARGPVSAASAHCGRIEDRQRLERSGAPTSEEAAVSEVDRLEAAIGECREMIREAHAATKDLRAAVREAKES